MATRKTSKATKKAANDGLPTEFEISGETYEVTPREEWTIEQDDIALSVVMELRSSLKEEDIERDATTHLVQTLIESGLYRKMLGTALRRKGDPRTVSENIQHFAALRGLSDPTPIVAAVAVFFGSGNS